jgi:epsin
VLKTPFFCSNQILIVPFVQTKVDLFASQPAISSSAPSTVNIFAVPDPVAQPEAKAPNSASPDANIFDPFAAVPLNSFDGSDLFGAFTSHSDSVSSEPAQNDGNGGSDINLNEKSSADSKTPPKKNSFQVKSGIWADSLSRGLIDLNISARMYIYLHLD